MLDAENVKERTKAFLEILSGRMPNPVVNIKELKSE